MQIPKSVFGLYRFTDDEAHRYELGGIMFQRDASGSPIAAASNGNIMVAVGWDDDYSSVAFEAIVPTEACRQMYAYGEVDGCVTIDKYSDDSARCVLGAYAHDTEVNIASPVLEGRFPKYQYDFKPTAGATVVKLKVSMLNDVLATFADMEIDDIVIAVVNHETVVTMTGTNADGVSIAVAAMPKSKDDGTATVLGWTPGVVEAKSYPLAWTTSDDGHGNEYLWAKGPSRDGDKLCLWRLFQRLRNDDKEWYSDSDVVLGPDVPESWRDQEDAKDAIQKAHDTIMQSRE